MPDLVAGGSQIERTARVSADHHGRPRPGHRPVDGGHLLVPDLCRQIGLQHGERPPGPTAKTFVIKFHHRNERRQNGPHGTIDPLNMSKVARVLDDDWLTSATEWCKPVQALDQPLVHIGHPGREGMGLLGAEQVAVLLEHGSAAGRVG